MVVYYCCVSNRGPGSCLQAQKVLVGKHWASARECAQPLRLSQPLVDAQQMFSEGTNKYKENPMINKSIERTSQRAVVDMEMCSSWPWEFHTLIKGKSAPSDSGEECFIAERRLQVAELRGTRNQDLNRQEACWAAEGCGAPGEKAWRNEGLISSLWRSRLISCSQKGFGISVMS